MGITWLIMTARFVLGGLGASLGDFKFEIGATAMIDYGAAVAAVLAVWLGREWINGKKGDGDA